MKHAIGIIVVLTGILSLVWTGPLPAQQNPVNQRALDIFAKVKQSSTQIIPKIPLPDFTIRDVSYRFINNCRADEFLIITGRVYNIGNADYVYNPNGQVKPMIISDIADAQNRLTFIGGGGCVVPSVQKGTSAPFSMVLKKSFHLYSIQNLYSSRYISIVLIVNCTDRRAPEQTVDNNVHRSRKILNACYLYKRFIKP